MRVLVTGATGFVGSHTVVALLRAGHRVRLLVRRPEQVPVTFAPHRIEPDDVADMVAGDVLDRAAVSAAVRGCDAVVHAAAIYSFDPRAAKAMRTTNADATEMVLDAALAGGCDPIVHVSSTVALMRRGGTTPDLPLGDLTTPYAESKIESERLARLLQQVRAPVVSVYPGAVYGPHDPYRGEQTRRMTWLARGLFPLWPAGGMHVVDVRETAATITAALEPDGASRRAPRRYVVPGHHADADAIYGAVSSALGRRRPHLAVPAPLVTPVTAPIDALQRLLPTAWRYPADREAGQAASRDTRFDDTPARTELGVTTRPWNNTIADMLTWMVDAGHLPQRYRPAPQT